MTKPCPFCGKQNEVFMAFGGKTEVMGCQCMEGRDPIVFQLPDVKPRPQTPEQSMRETEEQHWHAHEGTAAGSAFVGMSHQPSGERYAVLKSDLPVFVRELAAQMTLTQRIALSVELNDLDPCWGSRAVLHRDDPDNEENEEFLRQHRLRRESGDPKNARANIQQLIGEEPAEVMGFRANPNLGCELKLPSAEAIAREGETVMTYEEQCVAMSPGFNHVRGISFDGWDREAIWAAYAFGGLSGEQANRLLQEVGQASAVEALPEKREPLAFLDEDLLAADE